MRDARYFFKQLSDLGAKISYVVGNHDHHLAIMRQENDFLGRASRGEIYPVFNPSLCWNQTIAGLNVDMYYPIYRANYSQRSYLFTHGHQLSSHFWRALDKVAGAKASCTKMSALSIYSLVLFMAR
jgi:hypothetical protein